MIKIIKSPKPDILESNEDKWRDEYIRLIQGEKGIPEAARTRYRNPEIKKALREESHDKCIFCESKISHIFPGETDHIIPSSKKPEYIVKWENLGHICKECNRFKSNYHDELVPLINPFLDDPEEYFNFWGPVTLAKPGSRRGVITAKLLKFYRPALLERKMERIRYVQTLIDQLEMFPDGSAREFLLEQISEEANETKEYSATIKCYLDVVLA